MTNQTLRVLELLKRFNNGQKVCMESLQCDILWEGKSDKTIRRDLDVIKEIFPESFELIRGEKGCYKAITKKSFESFMSQEMIALMVKTFALAQHNNLFDSLTIDQSDKRIIEKKIEEHQKIYLFKNKLFEKHIENSEIYKKIEKAIKYKQKLYVTYEINATKIKKHSVKPYKILFMQENFYLAGEVENEKYIFTPLRISKIKELEVLSETFYHNRMIDNFIKDMQTPLAIYSEDYKDKLIEVLLEVDTKKVQYFKVKKHLPSQEIIEEKENGNLVLSFKVTQNMEIEELVKKWIPHIKVLAPMSLKKKIEKDIKEYLSKYN